MVSCLYEYNDIGSSSPLTETDVYELDSLRSGQCFPDELMICTFMVCSGKVTRELLSNRLLQMLCIAGVKHRRMVYSNFTRPEAAGVTVYADVQHLKDPNACEGWFYSGHAQGLIQEYVQRAIPAMGISRYQRSVRSALHQHFLVVYTCVTLHSE